MFSLSHTAIDSNLIKASLEDESAGALAVFEGRVRNHNEGQTVTRLEYEAYEALCLSEAEKIISEALAKFEISKARCVHRVGVLPVGEIAVVVGVSAAHRGPAFDACRYIIDEVKARLPIWKKETYKNGDSGWVNCRHDRHGQADAHNPSKELAKNP